MIATRPDEVPVVSARAADPVTGGMAGWLTTGDHKRIGRLYIGASLVMLLGVLGVGIALQIDKVGASDTLLRTDAVAQLFSLYSWGLAFAVVLPLVLGVLIAVVPLQVGARTIAFPRAAALSFWTWLLSTGVMVGAYLDNGGPGGGSNLAVDLWLISVAVLVTALLIGAMCVGATVLALRTPGMSLDRVPLTSWAGLVWAAVLLLTLPVLVAMLIFLYVDHRYGNRQVFGGNAGISGYLSWAVTQPTIYLYALPVLGFVADVCGTASRSRQAVRGALVGFIAVAGIMGLFGVVSSEAFVPGIRTDFLFVVVNIISVLAPLGVLVLCGASFVDRRPRPTGPFVLALVTGLVAFVGVAAGALLPISGLELTGTVFELAVLNYVLLAGALGGLTALAYWGPKLWGRRLADGPVRGLAVLGLLAVVLVAFPDVILGFLGQPAAAVQYAEVSGGTVLNILSLVGYALLALVVVAFLLLAVRGFRRGDLAGDDPWDGTTLEWATASPPPHGNFAEAPFVLSPEPLLDRKEA